MVDSLDHRLGDTIKKMQRMIQRLQSARPLENTSIRNGRLRLIGALLRIDSGGRIEVIGQWRFVGPGAITGDVVAEGKWTQNGAWEFNGPGDIAGDVDLTGNFDLTGKLTAGNVRIEDGKIYVGAGASLIVIDGATGKILAGNMAIDPANGGSVTFPDGAVVSADSGGVSMTQGNYKAVVTSAGASVGKPGLNISVTDAVGLQFVGLPTITQSASGGLPVNSMYLTATNQPRRVVAG